ncbi:MAG TPA: ATP-binding cassette domain-containing protein [Gemmatimonadaceae bacterium]|nr:ATP-binding cassette domain-containing protein [Gemmatimonadaceae bacterium]
MPLAVSIDRISKRFANHVAVRDLSLQIPTGTVYGLLGPNGAGKTTTIRMILDVLEPDSGRIEILGAPNGQPGVVDRVGYLPEERGLYRRMTVRRVLLFLAQLKGVPPDAARRRIDGWLERLQLATPERDWGDARVEELSRGMQQKVQFIGALVHDPDVVILDEPFSALDPINAQALKDIIIELKRAGKTVIFSTHLMESAERLCDAVCIIAQGTKLVDGTLAEVRQAHGIRQVALAFEGGADGPTARVLRDPAFVQHVDDSNQVIEVDLAPSADPQRLLRALIDAGAIVQRFELVQPSLHRVFVDRVSALTPNGHPAGGADA